MGPAVVSRRVVFGQRERDLHHRTRDERDLDRRGRRRGRRRHHRPGDRCRPRVGAKRGPPCDGGARHPRHGYHRPGRGRPQLRGPGHDRPELRRASRSGSGCRILPDGIGRLLKDCILLPLDRPDGRGGLQHLARGGAPVEEEDVDVDADQPCQQQAEAQRVTDLSRASFSSFAWQFRRCSLTGDRGIRDLRLFR